MSDTIPKAGLVKALGLADDADEDTILEAAEAKIKAANDFADAQSALDAAQAKLDAKAPAAALPDGHVAISADVLDELKMAAKAGQEARAVQLRAERDDTISAAVREGKIAPARREHWTNQWDKDPEGTAAAIASLDAVHPLGDAPGYAGAPGMSKDAEDALYASIFGPDKQKASA